MKRKANNNNSEDNNNQLRVDSLVAAVSLLLSASNQRRAFLCAQSVKLCKKTRADSGWSCGYRNAQMLCSSLPAVPSFRRSFENSLVQSKLPFRQRLEPGLGLVPSIELIQSLIEYAWALGYDPEGAQQLKQTVVGTRKWIGTCEIYCLMHSLGLKVKVTDFPIATGQTQSHLAVCDWIEAYFDGSSSDFDKALAESHEFPIIFNRNNEEGIHDTEKLPLYFQYQGHSLTIIGIEVLNSGDRNILVLDPEASLPPKLLSNLDLFLRDEDTVEGTLKLFRFPESALRTKKAYQILEVVGAYDGVLDPENRKTFRTRKVE